MPKKSLDITTKEILNTREAAALLKVTTQTIKNYIYSGKLNAIKTPGGHHRIRRMDLKSLGFVVDDGNSVQQDLSMDDLWSAYNNLMSCFVATVEAFIKALDTRDIVSAGHSARVSNLACTVGNRMGMNEQQLQDLKLGGLLHDVGKIGISEAILGKPGRLTDQEFFLVKKHPEIGAQIVSSVDTLKKVAPIVRHHHERFDGKGYPDEVGGSEIELDARIIHIADSYDFLRSDLSFRSAYSVEESLQEIKNGAGSQFDPEVVNLFVDSIRQESMRLQ